VRGQGHARRATRLVALTTAMAGPELCHRSHRTSQDAASQQRDPRHHGMMKTGTAEVDQVRRGQQYQQGGREMRIAHATQSAMAKNEQSQQRRLASRIPRHGAGLQALAVRVQQSVVRDPSGLHCDKTEIAACCGAEKTAWMVARVAPSKRVTCGLDR
jgi:hypothetical protein